MSEETEGKRSGKAEFDKLERFIVRIRVAEVGNLSPEQIMEYQENLKKRGNGNSVMDVMREEAIERGIEIGLDEGINRGIIKGREEERKKLAIKLKAENVSLSIVSRTTGLTIEELMSL